jgi:diguanylate cyclase (GGDEF)-like protein/PAS domain S-box-containing protein
MHDQARQPAAVVSAGSPSGSPARILIVDDERMNRAILSQIIQRRGFATLEASSGMEALKLIEHEQIDLVLLDIVMPEMDGYEVLRQLRQRKTESQLPIIIVTASDDSQEIVHAFELGANDFVSKPIDPAVTFARINTQIKLQQAQAALRESEERYAMAAMGANDGLWDWNLLSNQVYYSPRWTEMLGVHPADVSNSPDEFLNRLHDEDRVRVEAEFSAHFRGETKHFEAELRMQHGDGTYRWMLCRGLAVRNAQGIAQRIAGSLTDITEGKVADGLTGLPNRLLFLDRVQRAVDRRLRHKDEQFAILYLDIDNFKIVNDSLGHEVGDQLLQAVARRLEDCVRASDSMVARLGGDEFAVVIEHIHIAADAHRVAQRILDAMSRPFVLCDRDVFTSASIGISFGEELSEKADDLLREADTAMYQAKANGKSRCRVFDPTMQEEVRLRLELEADLRKSLEREEFELYYQPIVLLENQKLAGFEALVRWRHPRRGLVLPGEFIGVVEETGLIVRLGTWVLKHACQKLVEWQSLFGLTEPLIISVNVSSRQLAHEGLVDQIAAIIRESGIRPSSIKLEVTESTIMQNPDEGAAKLSQLRELGVWVGIDDFGTGYSSLAYLHRLPLDILKVDRSFVIRMEDSAEHTAIVNTVLTLAKSLGLDAVAEGIESPRQAAMLREMGCKFGQGYLFARPMPANEAMELIRRSTGVVNPVQNRLCLPPADGQTTHDQVVNLT